MRRNILYILAVTAFSICTMLFLQDARHPTLDTKTFDQIPILHQGRVKPMESFARALKKQLSGTENGATAWLIETVFDPARGESTPVIKIKNPSLRNLLALNGTLFSYKTVSEALSTKQDIVFSLVKTPEEDLTPAQRDLIILQRHTVLLGDLLSSLSLFLPLAAESNKTYLTLEKQSRTLETTVKKIVKHKGTRIENFSPDEKTQAALAFALTGLRESGQRSTVFRVIQADGNRWYTPWAVPADSRDALTPWQNMATAYHASDIPAWQAAAERAQRGFNMKAEALYNQTRPFQLALCLYGMALLTLTLGQAALAHIALAFGAGFHLFGVALRIWILARPPVSTLFESIVCVGLIAALYGFWHYRRDQNPLWLYIGSAIGFLLLLLGFSQDQSNDNLMMLPAVLNTNFWLATHVICITIGYAFCLITSLQAHCALMVKSTDFKSLQTTGLMALLFSTVGTVLGGIWADQSWGRFWGWDPKENGALLIVLWLVWLLHGRISGQLRTPLVTAGLAFLSVIVALSWFGVNLLSVGLHSYGFTDTAAWGLGVFALFEITFISALLWRAHAR